MKLVSVVRGQGIEVQNRHGRTVASASYVGIDPATGLRQIVLAIPPRAEMSLTQNEGSDVIRIVASAIDGSMETRLRFGVEAARKFLINKSGQ